ncbi:MAG: hypothetical protein HC837_12080 [Chloroflexaceae bacterium]|nr:hypothetical protein [Chloroflexaceae bacterium]
MKAQSQMTRSLSYFCSLLLVGMVLLSNLPAHHTQAQSGDPSLVTVTDVLLRDEVDPPDQLGFVDGTLQRTQLAIFPEDNDLVANDNPGAVQLALVGAPREWNERPGGRSGFDLPYRWSDMGTAVIGNRIYVVGGVQERSNQGDETRSVRTHEVYSAAVNQDPDASPPGRLLLDQELVDDPAARSNFWRPELFCQRCKALPMIPPSL